MGTVAPATGTALILLVAFVLPGFVTVLLQERTFKSADDPTPFDRLLRAVYYSLWCYVLLAVAALIARVDRPSAESFFESHEGNPAVLAFLATVIILLPAIAVWYSTLRFEASWLKAWMLTTLRINERHPKPTGWDFWFRQCYQTHVRVVYPDGTSVWGYYGADSFASYAKDGRDLYLEAIYRERTVADDGSDDRPGPWFGNVDPNSYGGWVNVDSAVLVELYDLSNADEASRTATDQPGSTGAQTVSTTAQPALTAPTTTEEGLTDHGQ
jgi:hypothetical protein